MLPRLVLRLAPILALVTAGFGLWHLWSAIGAARRAAWPFVALSALLGVAGLAMASALWRLRRYGRG